MKIRQGFVSNSSSSSFCLVGSEYGYDELEAIAKTMGIEYSEDRHWESMEKITEHLEKKGLEVHQGEDHIVFGYPVETDTTIDSQIEWAQNEFKEIGIQKKAYFDYGEVCSG